jgi:peptidoglycan L-alanyl-D-glutamate endopeptidase CwlK
MSLGQEQEAFARDLVRLLTVAFSKGYEVRIGEVERTLEQQEIYVRAGRSKTMNSLHLKKCAADLHFFKNGKLCYPEELGEFWESLSPQNSWGGKWVSFKDSPHFERRV